MTIQFQCPHCQKIIRVRDELAGSTDTCNGCQRKITIPLSSGQQLAAYSDTPKADEPPFPQRSWSKESSPRLVLAVSIVAAVLIGGGIWLMLNQGDDEPVHVVGNDVEEGESSTSDTDTAEVELTRDPTASLRASYSKSLTEHPIPELIRQCEIDGNYAYSLDAAIAEIQDDHVTIRVCTDYVESDETIQLYVICLGPNANAADVGVFIAGEGNKGKLFAMASAAVVGTTMDVDESIASPEKVLAFSGFLQLVPEANEPELLQNLVRLHESDLPGALAFDGYIGIQLCSLSQPSPFKRAVSNCLWVRLQPTSSPQLEP